LLKELAQRVDHVVADVREAMDATADEPATPDLYIEVAQDLETQHWMLWAHLARPAVDGLAA
jgi:DNA-binding ferritin-like protein